MNIEGQEIETYQIFVASMGNAKITEELDFFLWAPVIKYQSREDFDDKEALRNLVTQRDNMEK